MNTYWISLPCDLLSSLASFQCSLLHPLHLSSDLGLSKYVNQHSHLNLSRNVRLPVLYDLDFNTYHHINKYLQKYTTHQFTYFTYYLFHDKFKNPKIIKIQQLHQKIHAKQFLLFYLHCFLI